MSSHPRQPDETLREELVAYLDGELSAAESESMERRIGRDEIAREELQRFDRVWNALDQLPQVTVGDNFTRTTLEMATVEAQQELAAETAMLPVRKRNRWLQVIGMVAAAVLVGFIALAALVPNPNRELVTNLPVIVQLDAYSEVRDMDFLRQLHATSGEWLKNEWGPEVQEDVEALDQLSTANYRERREFINTLSDDRRTHLASKHRRYQSLTAPMRAELTDWHSQLASDADAEELQQTLLAYFAWLSQVDEVDQARLRSLPVTERVERIEEMHADAVRESHYRLTPANAAALRKAMGVMATDPRMLRLTKQLMDEMPDVDELPEGFPRHRAEALHRLKQAPPHVVMRTTIMVSGFSRTEIPFPRFKEYRQAVEEGLIAALDEQTVTRLRGMDDRDRRRLLAVWVARSSRQQSKPDVATLEEYFVSGGISEEDQARLLALPTEQMLEELERMYFAEYFSDQDDDEDMREMWRRFGGRWGQRGRRDEERGRREANDRPSEDNRGPRGAGRGPRNGPRGPQGPPGDRPSGPPPGDRPPPRPRG